MRTSDQKKTPEITHFTVYNQKAPEITHLVIPPVFYTEPDQKTLIFTSNCVKSWDQ